MSVNVGLVIGNSSLLEEVRAALVDKPVRMVLEQREIGDWGVFLDKLERVLPDILLLGLDELADSLEDVVRQIKATANSPKIIVVHDSAEPEVILRAIRANADEFLFPPLKEDLHRALDRIGGEIVRRRAGTKPRGKVFGFLSAKGGCGATTVACHIAVELHRQTRLEVLLADFDLDSGMISFLMKSQGRYSLMDAVANLNRLDLSFWKALVSNGTPGIEVIMAPPMAATSWHSKRDELKHVIPFVRSNYDWTLIDLGKGVTPMVVNLIDEIDETYLVSTLEVPALHQTKSIVQMLLDAGYAQHRLRVLINRMPKRSEVSLEELDRMLGVPIYATIPNDFQTINDAYSEGRLVSPDSHLGRHFARVAAKIGGSPQRQQKKRHFLSFL